VCVCGVCVCVCVCVCVNEKISRNGVRGPARPYSSSGAGSWVVLRHCTAATEMLPLPASLLMQLRRRDWRQTQCVLCTMCTTVRSYSVGGDFEVPQSNSGAAGCSTVAEKFWRRHWPGRAVRPG